MEQESARTDAAEPCGGGGGGGGGVRSLSLDRSQSGRPALPRPLRKALDFNAGLTRDVFDERGLAPTYPLEKAEDLRINGIYGLKEELVPESYRLQVVGVADAEEVSAVCDGCDDVGLQVRGRRSRTGPHDSHDTKDGAEGRDRRCHRRLRRRSRELKAKQGDERPRGQEEAGESDSTLDAGTPGLLLTHGGRDEAAAA